MQLHAVTAYRQPLVAIEVPTPSATGKEALVRVTGCGLCHSDLHIHEGKFDMGGGQTLDLPDALLPLAMGHEIEGVVEALGPEANRPDLKIGDRVAVYPWLGCEVCSACRRGEQHLCSNNKGLGTRRHGGFATHVHVPTAEALIPVGDLAPGGGGVAMCSGLTAYGALAKLEGAERTAPILLIGLGGVGLAGLAIAKALWDGPVIAADVNPAARDLALQRGAAEAVDPADPAILPALMARGDIVGAIDFVGRPETTGFGIQAVRRGGRVVIVGLYGGALPLSTALVPMKALSIIGSYVGSLEEAKALVALMREGRVAAPLLQTQPLAQANAAIEALRGGSVRGRLVLTPG